MTGHPIENLSQIFAHACANFHAPDKVVTRLWHELQDAYSSKGRYYHTLDHLNVMSNALFEALPDVSQKPWLVFALFYHDIVYKPLRSNNEEKSAEIAVSRLSDVGVPSSSLDLIREAIHATKGHGVHSNEDINYLLDADLAVLGSSNEEYQRYSAGIRKEFAVVPDVLYKPGRRKVLHHFLEMKSIYKTASFRLKFEEQARLNITRELKNLE